MEANHPKAAGSAAAHALVGDTLGVLFANQAACRLADSDPRGAIVAADRALGWTPLLWKATFRKCQALVMLGEYDKAGDVLKQALLKPPPPDVAASFATELARVAALAKRSTPCGLSTGFLNHPA